jgi:hypothetical protein
VLAAISSGRPASTNICSRFSGLGANGDLSRPVPPQRYIPKHMHTIKIVLADHSVMTSA